MNSDCSLFLHQNEISSILLKLAAFVAYICVSVFELIFSTMNLHSQSFHVQIYWYNLWILPNPHQNPEHVNYNRLQ